MRLLVCRLTYNGDVFAFKMGRRSGSSGRGEGAFLNGSAAVQQPPMRVNIKGCDQAARPRPGERINPAGTFDSNPPRSGGLRFFQRRPVPQAQGTIDCLLALARPYASQGLGDRRFRDGATVKRPSGTRSSPNAT
jgi:hypothetical protein